MKRAISLKKSFPPPTVCQGGNKCLLPQKHCWENLQNHILLTTALILEQNVASEAPWSLTFSLKDYSPQSPSVHVVQGIFNEVSTNSLGKFFCSLTGLIVSILPSLNFALPDFVSNYFPLSLVYFASFKYL